MSNGTKESVCAIVVTYYPDEGFPERLKKISKQVSLTIIIDNTPCGSLHKFEPLLMDFSLQIILNQTNKGIAAALNQGIKLAKNSYKWVITFDQDTDVYDNIVEHLIALYKKHSQDFIIIGSNYWNVCKNKKLVESSSKPKLIECKTIITSGTLLKISHIENIGFFREDYFIDSVDHEFCLRARLLGYRIYISREILMEQRIGNHKHHLFSQYVFDHAPIRKYYIARNCLITIINYFSKEPIWCIRQIFRLFSELLSIIFSEDKKLMKLNAFFLGIWHAMKGNMGPLIPNHFE